MTKGTLKPKLHIGVNSQNCIIRVFDKGKGNSNERFPRLTEGLRKRSKDWKEILCSGEEIAWAQKTFIWKGTRGSTGRATEQLNRACSLARVWGFTGSLEEDQGHIYLKLVWTRMRDSISLSEFMMNRRPAPLRILKGPNGSSWINLKFLIFSSHTPRRVKCSLVQGHSWGWKVSWWGSVLHPTLLWMFHMRVHVMVVEQQSAYGWEHWFVKKHLAARKRVLAGMD